MHVPVAVFSIYPGERSSQLGDEIVAPGLIAVPPAAGDALGTGDELELAFLYRDDLFQQPCRARPGVDKIMRIPFTGLDAAPGVLGPVVRIDADAVYRIASQAGLQPLQQPRPVLRLGHTVAAHFSEESAAACLERREIPGGDRDRFDRRAQLQHGEL